ncbi:MULTISPECIES: DUF1376 domain-containing protein [Sulfitobacter]|uniref:DUF1376 domain-containing protein n=1 Tax=Sulfitobacter TaxID=60136 RepID=UPI0024586F8A|nr:DUF1376 domain-containing protein [Sulfitobacter faviae]MDH4541050.1 hypothetical protein [Sulfitobacter faviae]
MSEGVPYIRFYGDDWLSGTQELSLEERGALVTIVALTSATGAAPVADYKRLSRRFGCTPAKAKKVVQSLIEMGKIWLDGDALINRRAQKETEISQKNSKKQSENAHARWSKSEGKSNENNGGYDAAALPPECQPEPKPEPYKIDDDSAGASLSFRERVLVAAGHDASGLTAGGKVIGSRAEWVEFENARSDLHLSEEDTIAVVRETANQKRDGPPGSLKYFIPSMRKFAGARDAPPVSAISPDPARPRGTQHERSTSKSKRRMDAFIAGARGTG